MEQEWANKYIPIEFHSYFLDCIKRARKIQATTLSGMVAIMNEKSRSISGERWFVKFAAFSLVESHCL